jgi:aminoglycoside 6'-N-acetyltransferase
MADGPADTLAGMNLEGARVRLRPVAADDVEPLTQLLQQPEVARWWPDWDRTRVEREFLRPGEGESHWAIEHDGQLVGLIQCYEEPDPEYRHASIDLFLDPAVRGRGLGPDAIRTLAAWLIDVRGHHRLSIDPALDNVAAITAYRKVGFRDVGVLRQYGRAADGTWVDHLLMDLLADELQRT